MLSWKPLLILFVYYSVICTICPCCHSSRIWPHWQTNIWLFSCRVIMDFSSLSFSIHHVLWAKCRQPCLSFLSEWSQLFPHSIQMPRWWEDLWMACRDLLCSVRWAGLSQRRSGTAWDSDAAGMGPLFVVLQFSLHSSAIMWEGVFYSWPFCTEERREIHKERKPGKRERNCTHCTYKTYFTLKSKEKIQFVAYINKIKPVL